MWVKAEFGEDTMESDRSVDAGPEWQGGAEPPCTVTIVAESGKSGSARAEPSHLN